ncbi:hypothetical protein MAR_006913, partial [Mya arenaria]
MESDENVNILVLLAVRQILFFAEDYLESRKVKQIRRRGKANSGQGESEVFGMGKRLTDKDFNQIESWIGTGPKTFNLLYSITRDGCDPDVFHKKCDNQHLLSCTTRRVPFMEGHAAIYNESNHGPIFGGDVRYDLRTFDGTIPPSSGEYTMTVSNGFGFNIVRGSQQWTQQSDGVGDLFRQ